MDANANANPYISATGGAFLSPTLGSRHHRARVPNTIVHNRHRPDPGFRTDVCPNPLVQCSAPSPGGCREL